MLNVFTRQYEQLRQLNIPQSFLEVHSKWNPLALCSHSPLLGAPTGRYSGLSSLVPSRLPEFHWFPEERSENKGQDKSLNVYKNHKILWNHLNDKKHLKMTASFNWLKNTHAPMHNSCWLKCEWFHNIWSKIILITLDYSNAIKWV